MGKECLAVTDMKKHLMTAHSGGVQDAVGDTGGNYSGWGSAGVIKDTTLHSQLLGIIYSWDIFSCTPLLRLQGEQQKTFNLDFCFDHIIAFVYSVVKLFFSIHMLCP